MVRKCYKGNAMRMQVQRRKAAKAAPADRAQGVEFGAGCARSAGATGARGGARIRYSVRDGTVYIRSSSI